MDLFKLKQPLYEAYLPRLGPEIVGFWRKSDRFIAYGILVMLPGVVTFFTGLQTYEPAVVIIGIAVFASGYGFAIVGGIFAHRAGKELSKLLKQKVSWSNSPIRRDVKKFDKWCNDHGLDPMALTGDINGEQNGRSI